MWPAAENHQAAIVRLLEAGAPDAEQGTRNAQGATAVSNGDRASSIEARTFLLAP